MPRGIPKFDETAETEVRPAMEIHLGEVNRDSNTINYRHAIIWINGKRWQGDLYEMPEDADE